MLLMAVFRYFFVTVALITSVLFYRSVRNKDVIFLDLAI